MANGGKEIDIRNFKYSMGEDDDYFIFIPFKSLCILLLILLLVFNKVFKTVSDVWFYCLRLLVAVSIDPGSVFH